MENGDLREVRCVSTRHLGMDYMSLQMSSQEGFVVIGAGLPRTGTMSLRAALGELLEGKCYHMMELALGSQVDLDHWNKALKGELTSEEWVNFLEKRGYRAGVDFPIALFYKDLLEAFPDAKVVLTMRDPEQWYKSVKNSIFKSKVFVDDWKSRLFLYLIRGYKYMEMTVKVATAPVGKYSAGLFGTIAEGEEKSIQFYNDWVEDVLNNVPRDRLLIFQVKDGWQPLCDFLGCPVPEDKPFPHVNDSKAVGRVLRNFQLAGYAVLVLGPIFLAGFFLACWAGLFYVM